VICQNRKLVGSVNCGIPRYSVEKQGFCRASMQCCSRGSVSVSAMVSAGHVTSWCSSAVRTPSAATQGCGHQPDADLLHSCSMGKRTRHHHPHDCAHLPLSCQRPAPCCAGSAPPRCPNKTAQRAEQAESPMDIGEHTARYKAHTAACVSPAQAPWHVLRSSARWPPTAWRRAWQWRGHHPETPQLNLQRSGSA
jgi:hypothetical protein